MPRRSSKKSKSSRPPRAVKREITEAVDLLSAHITSELKDIRHSDEDEQPGAYRYQPDPHEKARRRLAFSCVTIITLAVIGLWIWNAQTMWYDLKRAETAEGELFDEAKSDIGSVLSRFSADAPTSDLRKALDDEVNRQQELEQQTRAAQKQAAEAEVARVLGTIVRSGTTTEESASTTNTNPE